MALPDTRALTQQRFERMTLTGRTAGPPVDTTGLPAGPRWPALAQTVALLRFRHRFHPWLHRTFGDRYTVRLLPRARPVVFVTRPEQVREVFAGDPDVLHAGKGNAVLGPVMGEHSLLLQDGEEHRRARRLLMPAFSSAALRGYAPVVTALARDEVAHWPRGTTFRSHERMNVLTLEVILRVVFGVTDPARLAALRPRVLATVNVHPAVLLVWSVPALHRLGPWRRAVQDQVELDQLVHAEIQERRCATDLAERSDVLSRLLREAGDELSDTELRDQLVTLLLAGHETTATALAWALHEVGRDPQLHRRTRAAALDDGPDGEAWLDAVLKESLRLHPVIPIVVRTLTEPRTIAGIDLPRGATVSPSIIVSHHRPESFPEPERFDPERFLGQQPPPNSWIPFGGGARRCIGAGFAAMEGVAVLREVFRVVSVESVGEEAHRVRNITSVPSYGARVRVRDA